MSALKIRSINDFDAGEACYSEPPTVSEWTVHMNNEARHFIYGNVPIHQLL
ncbi:hypothetical protein [Alkalibacterium pelagium]|uniref:hypothetical protein n=1 Tax=Alkalibacterium pelagium TaxID=426702 RepID=UPI001478F1E0|nr:hypothetical protein [Alkalibacterium pelagium]